ncbi:MAG: carbohydrate ABC transporter permease [Oscillospiraceae bacterium]|nr:carbohydrate ABC transporter permease [Oscillospiraceae bacterium]
MAEKDIKNEINTSVPEEAAEVVQTAEAVESAATAEIEETAAHAADALKDTKVRVSDDDAKVEKKYTRKELRQLEKERKALHKQYHVSNWEILRNYKTYGTAEKQHYRYIFGRRIASKVWPIFRFLILFGLGFVIMYPMLFMISAAFRPQSQMNDPSIMWIPKNFIFSNITDTWGVIDYPSLLWNTLSVNIICSLLQVVTCSITGYGFARFKFKFRGLLFVIVILQIIVPTQIVLIPQFMQFRYFDIFGIFAAILKNGEGLNLTDSPWALYLQAVCVNGIRSGLFVLLFRQFFRGLPKELEDAAHLDGCGPFSTFIRIMVPNARTSFLTVFIFSLVWYWNDSYVSGMFYTKSNTIALQVSNLAYTISSWRETTTGLKIIATDCIVWIEAGCLLSLIPILLIYCFLQKYFIEGIERSGITGM